MNIHINGLTKAYDGKTVLNIEKVSFIEGKGYGIIGPNGAGKSTLLKIIAGLEKKDQGAIYYDEGKRDTKYFNSDFSVSQDNLTQSAFSDDGLLTENMRKKITYLSQSPYLLRTSVYNNIAYPLKIRKLPKTIIEKKVNEIMKELNVYDLRNQLATSLSGGESQKVVLARALVFEPELLLLDEPTANIDPQTIEVLEKAILKRNSQNKMITITITHNMGQVHRMCDDVIYIEKGKIIDQGTTEKVLNNPLNPFIEYYL